MNNVWGMNISDFIEVYEEAIELGKQRGKKEGDNLEAEFFAVAKKKNKLPEHLGETEKDKDLLTGDLRENGLRIINLDEEKRKKKDV